MIVKKIALFLLVLWSFLVNAQSNIYKPFPTTYGNWVYLGHDEWQVPSGSQTNYILNGDTVISNINYKKIFTSYNYSGALREFSKIIYFVPKDSLSEVVLYDFNLTIGDTIIHPFGGAVCSNDTVLIIAEDSVLASDGYHRQLILNSPYVPWIEGIGSWFYLLMPAQVACVSSNDVLMCMTSDTSFIYPSSFSYCTVSSPEIENTQNDIFICPNPSNGSFSVKILNYNIRQLVITDLLGKIVLIQEVQNQREVEALNLGVGTYFLNLIDVNGQTNKKKIISLPH